MKGSLSLSTLVMCLILSMGLVTPLITVMSYSDDIGKMGSILGEVTGGVIMGRAVETYK